MKKIKFLFFALISSAFIATSCSTDEDVNINSSAQHEGFELKSDKVDTDEFIREFYGDSFVYGNSIQTADTIRTYSVTEVIVGTDTRPRGYIALDNVSKQPIGFIDVDRNNAIIKSYDFQTKELVASGDLSQDPIFIDNGYDFISIIDQANQSPNGVIIIVGVTIDLGNFWDNGVSHGPCNWEVVGGTFQYVHDVTIVKKRFWITWSTTTIEDVPC